MNTYSDGNNKSFVYTNGEKKEITAKGQDIVPVVLDAFNNNADSVILDAKLNYLVNKFSGMYKESHIVLEQ